MWLWLTLPIGLLLIIATLAGILSDSLYQTARLQEGYVSAKAAFPC